MEGWRTMSDFLHSPMPLQFGQVGMGTAPSTYGRIGVMYVKNVSEVPLRSGEIVALRVDPQVVPSSNVCVGHVETTSVLNKQKVAGFVEQTQIDPGEMGYIRFWGRHTGVWVTGGFSAGDILSSWGTDGLCSEIGTPNTTGCAFASSSHAGNRSKIAATIALWRI